MFGWLQRNKVRKANEQYINAVREFASVYNSGVLNWKNVWGIINSENMEKKEQLDLSAIYCAMSIYTGSSIGLPRSAYRVDPNTRKRTRALSTTDHPAVKIYRHRANPDWSSDDMMSTAIHDVLWFGNMYAMREFDVKGQTSRIYYIHPSRIPKGNIKLANGSEDLSTGRKAVKGEKIYIINTGTASESHKYEHMILPADLMVHLKNHIVDTEYFCGVGIRENAAKSLGLYRASEDFGHSFYTRGIATQMFLTTEHRVSPDVLKRLESQFEENPNKPLEEAFKTRILEQGLKPVHMGIPFQHLQFIETRAFSVEDVSRWFNIPPALLHSKMGRGGSEESFPTQISLFVQFDIGPLLTRICNQLRDELIPVYQQPNYDFGCDRIYLFRTVINELTVALRNMFEIGVLDRERIADILGTTIELGDKFNNQRYVPTNLMTVEHSKAIEKKAQQALESGMIEIDRATEEVKRLKESPTQAEVMEQQAKAAEQQPNNQPDSQDDSPDEHTQDKRLRGAASNAFKLVIDGLKQYEAKVLNQKKESRPDDYEKAVEEFYAADGKFHNLLNTTLSNWSEVINEVSEHESVDLLISNWMTNKGLADE